MCPPGISIWNIISTCEIIPGNGHLRRIFWSNISDRCPFFLRSRCLSRSSKEILTRSPAGRIVLSCHLHLGLHFHLGVGSRSRMPDLFGILIWNRRFGSPFPFPSFSSSYTSIPSPSLGRAYAFEGITHVPPAKRLAYWSCGSDRDHQHFHTASTTVLSKYTQSDELFLLPTSLCFKQWESNNCRKHSTASGEN